MPERDGSHRLPAADGGGHDWRALRAGGLSPDARVYLERVRREFARTRALAAARPDDDETRLLNEIEFLHLPELLQAYAELAPDAVGRSRALVRLDLQMRHLANESRAAAERLIRSVVDEFEANGRTVKQRFHYDSPQPEIADEPLPEPEPEPEAAAVADEPAPAEAETPEPAPAFALRLPRRTGLALGGLAAVVLVVALLGRALSDGTFTLPDWASNRPTARDELQHVAAALRSFERDSGSVPGSIADLAPRYLGSAPAHPEQYLLGPGTTPGTVIVLLDRRFRAADLDDLTAVDDKPCAGRCRHLVATSDGTILGAP